MIKVNKIYLFSVLIIFYCSCKKDKVIDTCNPPDVVSFQQHIQPIFNSYCVNSGCHSGTNPGGHLNLESSVSYAQLMKPGRGYIDTLQPEYSLLYAQLNSSTDIMPKTGKLGNCTIELVLKWIQQKAKNN